MQARETEPQAGQEAVAPGVLHPMAEVGPLPPVGPPVDGGGPVDEVRVAAVVAISRRATPELLGAGPEMHEPLFRLMSAVQHPDVPREQWIVDQERRLRVVDQVWSDLQAWLVDVDERAARRVSGAFRSIQDTLRTEWALDELDADDALADLAGDPVQRFTLQIAELASAWDHVSPTLSEVDLDHAIAVPMPDGTEVEVSMDGLAKTIGLASNLLDALRNPMDEKESFATVASLGQMMVAAGTVLLMGAQQLLQVRGLVEEAAALDPAIAGVGRAMGAVMVFIKAAVVAIELADGEQGGEDLYAILDLAADVTALTAVCFGVGPLSFAVSASWLVHKAAIRQMGETRLDITGAMLVDDMDLVTGNMDGVQTAHEKARVAMVRAAEQSGEGPDFRRAASALAAAVLLPLQDMERVVGGLRAQLVRGRLLGVFALHRPTLANPTPEHIHTLCDELAREVESMLEELPELVRGEAGLDDPEAQQESGSGGTIAA